MTWSPPDPREPHVVWRGGWYTVCLDAKPESHYGWFQSFHQACEMREAFLALRKGF